MTYFIEDFKGLVQQSGGLARSNVYSVELPLAVGTSFGANGPSPGIGGDISKLIGLDLNTINMLCKSTQLPGRQILSHDRIIGNHKSKVAYGYAVDDVTLTFHVMNDYKIKSYFEGWMNKTVNNSTYEAGYYNEYVSDIRIKQLRKGIGIPVYQKDLDFLQDIPSNIRNRLPSDIGPVDLSQAEIQLAFITEDLIMYECVLQDAYPTSMNSITLSDGEQNGLVELTVQMSYRNWVAPQFEQKQGDIFAAIGTVLDGIGIF
jgi:hypothetical protein